MGENSRAKQEFHLLRLNIEDAQNLLTQIDAKSHAPETLQEAIDLANKLSSTSNRIGLRLYWLKEYNG